jgi:hypothetical protein
MKSQVFEFGMGEVSIRFLCDREGGITGIQLANPSNEPVSLIFQNMDGLDILVSSLMKVHDHLRRKKK